MEYVYVFFGGTVCGDGVGVGLGEGVCHVFQ